MIVLFGIGFLAGVITAISPCVLPVLPILLTGGAAGQGRRPLAIVGGLVASFTVFTLAGAWLLNRLGLPQDFLRDLALALLFLVAATLLVPELAALLERPFRLDLWSCVNAALHRRAIHAGAHADARALLPRSPHGARQHSLAAAR